MSNAPRDARAKRDWGSDDSATPILHVDMDSFFAQVEMREDPSLVGRPIIVGGTSGRGVVTSPWRARRHADIACPSPVSARGLRSWQSRPVSPLLSGGHEDPRDDHARARTGLHR